jgi:V8-like Glu-specific endopeptidase
MASVLRFVLALVIFSVIGCVGCSPALLTSPSASTPVVIDIGTPVSRSMQSTGVLLRKREVNKWKGTACAIEYIGATRLITAHHCVLSSGFTKDEYDRNDPFQSEPNVVGREVRWVTYESVLANDDVTGDQMRGFVVAADSDSDVALVVLATPGARSSNWFNVRVTDPRIAEPVFTIGHPGGLVYSFSSGHIAYPLRTEDKTKYVQADLGIYYGNSGGALIDAGGNLIGICSARIDDSHIGFFTHPSVIRALMVKVGWN